MKIKNNTDGPPPYCHCGSKVDWNKDPRNRTGECPNKHQLYYKLEKDVWVPTRQTTPGSYEPPTPQHFTTTKKFGNTGRKH